MKSQLSSCHQIGLGFMPWGRCPLWVRVRGDCLAVMVFGVSTILGSCATPSQDEVAPVSEAAQWFDQEPAGESGHAAAEDQADDPIVPPIELVDPSQQSSGADSDTGVELQPVPSLEPQLEEREDLQETDQGQVKDTQVAQDPPPAALQEPAAEPQIELQPEPIPVPLDEDGPRYLITKLDLAYMPDRPGLPPVGELLDAVGVDLVRTETGFVAARDAVPSVRVPLVSIDDQLPHLSQFWFYGSALRQIAEAVVYELNRRGYIGVFVSPDPEQIEDSEDERPEDETSLRLVIQTVMVTEARTLGSGDRVSADERIDHPIHRHIIERSPVRPAVEDQGQRHDLLRRDLLDDYVYRLNRHPGRRVDVAVSRAQEQGGVVLDYLVTENRPLLAYFQVSNTGTDQTDEWRERFGLIHNQLTDRDDIFSVDYVTAGFDESHTVVASYEAPLGQTDDLRWRIFGLWGEFTATDVGAAEDQFVGESWSYGGELIANVLQRRDLFVDLVVGVRQEQIEVDNQAINQKGKDSFFFTYVGLNLERITEVTSALATVSVERHFPSVNDTDQAEIDNFGRTDPAKKWTLLKWNATYAFYLEPLMDRKAWADVNTPETSTLAHEIAVSFKGQHSFGARLIPQMEQVAGGLYTVRGYEESAAAGDTVLITSVEYRYHVPRAFKVQPNPSKTRLFGKPFRYAPQQVYGRPDWDLIFKAFFDAGHVNRTDKVPGEGDDTLLGTGVGLEFQFQRNFNVRVDWGVALEDAGSVQDGSEQVHVVATLLF